MLSCICFGIGELLVLGLASLFGGAGAIIGRKTAKCDHAHTCAHDHEHPETFGDDAPQMNAAVRRSGLVALGVILFGAAFALGSAYLPELVHVHEDGEHHEHEHHEHGHEESEEPHA